MLNTGRLTGDYDAESGYIGVKLSHGEEIFARPMCQIPVVGSYTKKWVEKYGKHFIALIDYENDVKERPILMGLVPLKNPKYPEEGYENNFFLISNNFRVWLNDDDNEMVLDLLDDGIIKLGGKDVTEPAVLGNVAVTLLNEFISDLGKLGTITTSTGVTALISTSPQWQPLVAKWEEKWKEFNSEKVFLK
jgi:hypothetical protein